MTAVDDDYCCVGSIVSIYVLSELVQERCATMFPLEKGTVSDWVQRGSDIEAGVVAAENPEKVIGKVVS